MNTPRYATALTLACMLQGCSGEAPDAGGPTEPAAASGDAGAPAEATEARLFRWLTGRYDSSKQATTDRSYYAIDLTMCPVDAPAYGTRTLYVEQAMAGRAPYRQRLYVVEPVAGEPAKALSRVFEFAQPDAMVGFCKSGKSALPSGVVAAEKPGCGVVLTWNAETATFTGGTTDKGCASSLNGAKYTSSEVTIESARMVSWDRGFDAQDKQVWGATKGGYVFDRLDGPVTP
jgi:CpeT protein